MGTFTNALLAAGLANWSNRQSRPTRIVRRIYDDHNNILFGGPDGSRAQDKALTLLEGQLDACLGEGYPVIVMTTDDGWAGEVYDMCGNTAACFGVNAVYDPFAGCLSMDDADFVMESIAAAYAAMVPGCDRARLLVTCKTFLRIIEQSFGMQFVTYASFSRIGQAASDSNGVLGFWQTVRELGGTVSPAQRQSLEREWTTSLPSFSEFLSRLDRSLAPYRRNGNAYSAAELLAGGHAVLLSLRSMDSALVTAALFAELGLLSRRGSPFCLIDYDVPIPVSAEQVFSYSGGDSISYSMYFPSLRRMQLPLETFSPTLHSLICLGALDAADARQMIAYCSSDRLGWVPHFGRGGMGAGMQVTPDVQPSHLLFNTRGGIRDGGACIFDPGRGLTFCTSLLV